MIKFKFTIFDADIGGNVHEETTTSCRHAIDLAVSVIDSYECEEDFADEREISESKIWNTVDWEHKLIDVVLSSFFDSISIWLPGHHRKIIIAKIEEND